MANKPMTEVCNKTVRPLLTDRNADDDSENMKIRINSVATADSLCSDVPFGKKRSLRSFWGVSDDTGFPPDVVALSFII